MARKNKKIKTRKVGKGEIMKISNTVRDVQSISKFMRTGLSVPRFAHKSAKDYNRNLKHKSRNHNNGNDYGFFLCFYKN